MPRLPPRAATRRPCATKARLRPTSGTTSQTVPRATRSSQRRRSGSGALAKWPRARSARLSATIKRNVTPTAARWPSALSWSQRFGLITASAGGRRGSAAWWSTTITSWPRSAAMPSASNAVVPRIERHHEAAARLREALQRRRVRAIALAQPVGNVDRRGCADRAEIAAEQRRRGRAVDVVVGEDADRLAGRDRVRQPLDRDVEIEKVRRIGQAVADPRPQEGRRRVERRRRAPPARARRSPADRGAG